MKWFDAYTWERKASKDIPHCCVYKKAPWQNILPGGFFSYDLQSEGFSAMIMVGLDLLTPVLELELVVLVVVLDYSLAVVFL